MKIKDGGVISNLKRKTNIEEVRVVHSSGRRFELWINDDCLSYLSLDEILDLREEINKAVQAVIK